MSRKTVIGAQPGILNVGPIPLEWGYKCVVDALNCHNAVLDFEIPAAAEWIAITGKRLYVGADDEEESWALKRRSDFGKELKSNELGAIVLLTGSHGAAASGVRNCARCSKSQLAEI